MKKPAIDSLLNSNDTDSAANELYHYILDLCSHGDQLSRLTEPQRNFFYIQELQRGAYDRDFRHYFNNPSGRFAHEALAALDMIGAEMTAGIVSFAMSCFPNERVPKDDEERRRQLEDMNKADNDVLRRMTQTLYERPEDLNELCMEYVRENTGDF
ncbi:MAG: DUF4375 domain-containing protein [Sphingobacteriales bacterium]|nr:MAG: DUF4375 domain-containing protein [Sphingobacteriales bacterium]